MQEYKKKDKHEINKIGTNHEHDCKRIHVKRIHKARVGFYAKPYFVNLGKPSIESAAFSESAALYMAEEIPDQKTNRPLIVVISGSKLLSCDKEAITGIEKKVFKLSWGTQKTTPPFTRNVNIKQ